MKINLVKIKYGDTYCYKHKPLVFCCSELKNAYEDEYGDYPNIILTNERIWCNKDRDYKTLNLCISRQFYEEDYISTKNYPIKCCPYCGEKIKYTVDEEKDYSELYKTLIKIVDNLQKRIEVIDSRKEYTELCNYRDNIQEGLYALEDINNFNKFKEKLSIVNMHGILATADKIIKEKEKEKENENKETVRNEL